MSLALAGALLELDGIVKGYGTGAERVMALKGVTLRLLPGERVGICGPLGSGKSTLLRLVAGLVEPEAGVMRLAGETVWQRRWRTEDPGALRRGMIGVVASGRTLLPFLDALDNVALPLTLAGSRLRAARLRALELLDRLQLGRRAQAMPARLSAGEAQRVAIARALAARPRLLLADEPAAALGSAAAVLVTEVLCGLAREQGTALLVATHDERMALRLDRLLHMREGRIEAETRIPAS